MEKFSQNKEEELDNLSKTLNVIKRELSKETLLIDSKLKDVITSGKEMWEESVHFSDDLDRIQEMNHYLSAVNSNSDIYMNSRKKIENYIKLLDSPYFGRFDFTEEGFDDVEKIYVGLHNLMDPETNDIYIYDWRAPISSIFYRSELGKCSYNSPSKIIFGDISLKRQYKIKNSKLKFFFDSSIRINDDILQEVLSHNSSSKMKNIVQTIQKEQDIIIRDIENELLIVQGVAGSGKTSIALHRIAFLLYEGLSSKLGTNNIIIISPNSIFSKYISDVLPELGEDNVEEITFNDILLKHLKDRFLIESRESQLETLIKTNSLNINSIKLQNIRFKGSMTFLIILDRLIDYCERKIIDFKDVYYDGSIIESRQQLRNFFLINKINMPISKRLKRIENMILNKIHPLRKQRLEKLEKVVEKLDNHRLEIKSFGRLLAFKETKTFINYLHSFTELDYLNLYKMLFNKNELLLKLSKNLELPENISEIVSETNRQLNNGFISYEDSAALLYIKLKLEGIEDFSQIKQVVIDEAQDYYPLQYEIFKLLFNNAKYTILGDFNQTLEKAGFSTLYNDIEKILNKKKSVKLFLKKSYRSSSEINAFTQKLLSNESEHISFDRHEAEPKVIKADNIDLLNKMIALDIDSYYKNGYESIAIICKTLEEAKSVYQELNLLTDVKLFNNNDINAKKSALIIPSYMAKGLEFDVVIVYDASTKNYNNDFDKRLLYIACTRPLHQLAIYYTGEKNIFI